MLLLLTTALASVGAEEPAFRLDRSELALEMGVFGRDGLTGFTPDISMRWAATPNVAVELDIPIAIVDPSEGDTVAEAGNVNFAALFRTSGDSPFKVESGLRVAVGTTDIEGVEDVLTLGIGDAMYGAARVYAYIPGFASLLAPLRFEVVSRTGLFAEFDGYVGALLPTVDGLEASGLASSQFSGGIRASVVEARLTFGATAFFNGNGSDAQTFLEPAVRLYTSPKPLGEEGAAFFETRLLMNLDEPAGFAFDDGVYAVIFGLGYTFDGSVQ